jgi:hypothetical protein
MTRAQVVYNMLNPSAATELVSNYPAQDYGRLFDHATAADVGVVGIRVLAGGALSGSTERHPIGPGARSDPGRRADQSGEPGTPMPQPSQAHVSLGGASLKVTGPDGLELRHEEPEE